jgi:DNA-binding XRE family transcriptional regulator
MQKIMTPQGETLVVLPLAEYERLVDERDIATAERIKSDIASGRDELVPAALADRLLAGANPVREWRLHRAMTARALAAAAGISAAYLSEIENGRKEGSLSSMKRIANALSLDLDDLA